MTVVYCGKYTHAQYPSNTILTVVVPEGIQYGKPWLVLWQWAETGKTEVVASQKKWGMRDSVRSLVMGIRSGVVHTFALIVGGLSTKESTYDTMDVDGTSTCAGNNPAQPEPYRCQNSRLYDPLLNILCSLI